jgi:hypothetical protein
VINRRFDQHFSTARECFARAVAVSSLTSRKFDIAGEAIEVKIAGEELAPYIFPALKHLETNATATAFEICCWDQRGSQIDLPPRPWDEHENFTHGEIPSFIDEDHYLHINLATGTTIVADRHTRLAILSVGCARDINTYEIAAPFRDFFNWWGSKRALFQIHAGAVGYSDGGVLLVGRSGAGKSNTVAACIESDLFYVGDDCCLLDTAGKPFVHGLYSSAKLYKSDLDRYPLLKKFESTSLSTPENKALFFLHNLAPDRLVSGFPLKAILMPRIHQQRDTSLSKISPANVLLTMAPDNILRWPVVGRLAMPHLSRAVGSVPCYSLNVGSDQHSIAAAISDLLSQIDGKSVPNRTSANFSCE